MLSANVITTTSAPRDAVGAAYPEVLEIVEPSSFPGWDPLCLSHPDGSFFHTIHWMKVLAEGYGLTPVYLAVRGQGGVSALVPMFEVTNLGRRKGVCLPFTDACEPLLWETEPALIWARLIEFAGSRGWRRLEIRGGRLLGTQSPSVEYLGHVLDLSRGEAKLFERLHPAVRRAIRKGEREGVTVSISQSAEAVADYYRLHCGTRKRHGLPPQPFRLFQKVFEHVLSRGLGFVAIARRQERPVAGAVFFQAGGKFIYKFGASDRTAQHLRGNDLVMWEAIREAIRNGAASLHFGRTSLSNDGLRRFKLGWGAEEYPIQYSTFDLVRSMFIPDRDRAFGWHNRLFGAMPVWLARLTGSLLYKRFA